MNNEGYENGSKYPKSDIYNSLLEVSPEDFDCRLDSLLLETSVENEDHGLSEQELLERVDILLEFACREELPSGKSKVVETVVNGLLPILNKKDSEKITELLSKDYKSIKYNLDEIKSTTNEEGLAGKCLLGITILTFPGSRIIDEETGLDC